LAVIAALAGPFSGAESRAEPETPKWNKIARLTDGRTFVTDGNLVLDAAFAKPDSLPTDTVPTAWLQSFLATAQPDELRFQDLTRRTEGTGTYSSPKGMLLNPKYVDYLREVFGDQLRFRCSGTLDAVQIVFNGAAIGALMPMAP
jgi:hypothetical protein